jgi:hypothetical protein
MENRTDITNAFNQSIEYTDIQAEMVKFFMHRIRAKRIRDQLFTVREPLEAVNKFPQVQEMSYETFQLIRPYFEEYDWDASTIRAELVSGVYGRWAGAVVKINNGLKEGEVVVKDTIVDAP